MAGSNNKTIAKNTIFLYIRMFVSMIISLFTSRVVLQTLGVDDYGIYQAVGGIVGFMTFLNNALSTGTSRFLTFGLGEGNDKKLKDIFSTTMTAHICLAISIAIIAETVGLWFLHNKLVIPVERMDAAEFAFHLSILTAFFSLTQVPYAACIIAHEKMTIYAYTSIVGSVLNLVIVYLLTISPIDRLKFFALLLCVVSVGMNVYLRFYCVHRFTEARFRFSIEKNIFRKILSFSGWSLLSSGSIALNSQGILLLLNMFFSPAVVAARSISIQVNMVANQFVNSFQTAANPQIVKLYAAKDYEGSKRLLLQSTRFSYYLMLLLALPIFLTANQLLHLWLGIVPEYSVIFLQLIVIQSLFHVFDVSFYRALYAKGRIRENALISPTLGLIQFPIVYLLFKIGYSPVALSWAALITTALVGVVIKPILVIKIADYSWKDVLTVFLPCMKVTIASLPIPIIIALLVNKYCQNEIIGFFIIVVVTVSSVAMIIWLLGLDVDSKKVLKDYIRSKLTFLFHR